MRNTGHHDRAYNGSVLNIMEGNEAVLATGAKPLAPTESETAKVQTSSEGLGTKQHHRLTCVSWEEIMNATYNTQTWAHMKFGPNPCAYPQTFNLDLLLKPSWCCDSDLTGIRRPGNGEQCVINTCKCMLRSKLQGA